MQGAGNCSLALSFQASEFESSTWRNSCACKDMISLHIAAKGTRTPVTGSGGAGHVYFLPGRNISGGA
jgi:hypothetical protein